MSTFRRLLIAATALGLSIPGLLISAPTQAAAVGCSAGNKVAGDLNSDGMADIVVGVPSYANDRGAVDVAFSNGVRLFVTTNVLGLPGAVGDRFGESVAVADIDGDGCDDLAIGAPGRASGKGAVYLAKASGTSTLSGWHIFDGTAANGSFGAQVVLLEPTRQLVVSAPTADDGAAWEAGQVQVLRLSSVGAQVGSRVILTQNSPGVPGASESGDRFGTALAGQGRTIVIGTPSEAIGSRTQAGSVTLLSASAAAPVGYRGVTVHQDVSGVPGTAESDDMFGAAVAVKDNHVLVGVPGETIGSDYATGMVHLLHFDPVGRKATSLRSISQDTAGIPGSNEDGDYFGSAVALGINTLDQLTAAVGAPGEAIGNVLGAGMVTLFRANRTGGATATFRQGTGGVYGTPEAADHFGASLGIIGGDLNDGEAMTEGLVIGAPGENVGSTVDAGMVTFTRDGFTSYALLLEDTPSGMNVPAHAQYGEVGTQVAS